MKLRKKSINSANTKTKASKDLSYPFTVTNAALQQAPKSASLIHGGASMSMSQFTNYPNS